jgi:hypothetical protein
VHKRPEAAARLFSNASVLTGAGAIAFAFSWAPDVRRQGVFFLLSRQRPFHPM